MTTIAIKKIKDVYDIQLKGHAGYCPGNDIVCSAISILTYTLAQAAKDMEMDGKGNLIRLQMQPGNVQIIFAPDFVMEWETALNTVKAGYYLIQEAYPGYIEVIDRVGDKENGT